MIWKMLLLLVVVWLLQQRMGIYALHSLTGDLSVDKPLADPNEPLHLTIGVENRGHLPILYLKVSVSLPEETEFLDEIVRTNDILHQKKYTFACYLLPGQHIERKIRIAFPRRGVWHLGGLQFAAGDLLGLKEDYESRSVYTMTVIAPAPLPDMTPETVLGGLMGDRSVQRWIHEDPILSAGYREYTGREPQRAIAWTRSLASGQMMVRNYDHTTDRHVRLILLLTPDTEVPLLENAFSGARTLCDQLEMNSIPFSFVSNGELYSFLGSLEKVECGLGANHRNRILESLGRAGLGLRFSPEEMIRRESFTADPVQGYLLIVTADTPKVQMLARQLAVRTEVPVRIKEVCL